MGPHKIDLSVYPRKDHFAHFLTMAQPFLTMTVKVDITGFLERVRQAEAPFFLTFLYAVIRAANRIPAFRQRIHEEGILEYDHCDPSFTVGLPDGTYRYCLVHVDQPFARYLEEGTRKQAEALAAEHLEEEEDPMGQLFISSVPWVHYESLETPWPDTRFSNPSITWGKYQEEGGRVTIPVTVMVHHALADGIHVAAFYRNLEEELEQVLEQL
ncbi:MAG: chloramphenicol acetyltransferase [Clostridiales bacterium]|nr:chloramphenicol acetyltransferase [Clostridiales bacterium]